MIIALTNRKTDVSAGINTAEGSGGESVMEKELIMVSSVTYAMQGKEILRQFGIKAEVERTPKTKQRSGCGYSLYVPYRTDEAERILRERGIKVTGLAERGKRA